MGRGFGGDGDEDHGERDEGGVEGEGREGGEEATVAIEEEGKEVDELVGYYYMPGFDDTGVELDGALAMARTTYKSGCVSCQHPTTAEPMPRATDAEVKILPAHANQPVR